VILNIKQKYGLWTPIWTPKYSPHAASTNYAEIIKEF